MDIKEEIQSLLDGSTISEKFIELVIKRLESLTYEVQVGDGFLIAFLIQKVENTIRNSCNTTSIPSGLNFIATDMICGEFLMNKKQTDSLGEMFDFDSAVKQVSFGDTTVSLGGESMEQKLNSLFSYMINYGKDEFVCYRKMRW